jgi:hypothetical protein
LPPMCMHAGRSVVKSCILNTPLVAHPLSARSMALRLWHNVTILFCSVQPLRRRGARARSPVAARNRAERAASAISRRAELLALHCNCYRGPLATSANERKGGAVAMCRARQEGWSQAPHGGTGMMCESREGWGSQETARRPLASCRVLERKQAARRSRRGTRPPSQARCAASFPAFESQREECDQRRCTNQPTNQPTKPSCCKGVRVHALSRHPRINRPRSVRKHPDCSDHFSRSFHSELSRNLWKL